MSSVDPFAPPTDDPYASDDELPRSGTAAPREFDQFSLEPTGGPDLIPGTVRDPSVSAVRARHSGIPGFGAQPGVSSPPPRTRPRRLTEQDAISHTPRQALGFDAPPPPDAPEPARTTILASPLASPPAAGPAQLSVPSAASRALLVGLEAFDDFVEDNDIPLVAGGPKWPDPPELDREGRLVAFRTEPSPVKWGWAETWTSPPPQEWRTTTDGELDDDDEYDDHRGRDGSDVEDGEAAPTTQSPLGKLRGRREFVADEVRPPLDAPRQPLRSDRSDLDRPQRRRPEADPAQTSRPTTARPEALPTSSPGASRLPDDARRSDVARRPDTANRPQERIHSSASAIDPDTIRRDRDSAWSEVQPDVPRQRSFRAGTGPSAGPPVQVAPPVVAPPPLRDPSPPTPTPPRQTPRGREPRRRPLDEEDNTGSRRKRNGSRDERSQDDEERATGASRRRVWLAFGGLSIVFALLLQTFALQANSIPSTSMSPTLVIDDYVLVNKLSFAFGGPSRGDVVVFDRPESVASEDDVFIKRVIGLPGETITFVDGKVVIDGAPLDESYTASPNSTFPLVDQIPDCGPARPDGGCLIPQDSIFVMGDNRRNSSDSRRFGPIKKSAIEGRAFMRIWPSSRIGGL